MEKSSRKENTPTTNAESSAPSSPRIAQKEGFLRKRSRRFSSVLRRVSSEWNCFVLKLKSATQFSYSDEEAIDSLFETSDDDFFERTPRSRRCCKYSTAELHFIDELKRHKSLETYYEENREQTPASDDMPSVSASHTKPYHALDVSRLREKLELDLRESSGSSGSGASESASEGVSESASESVSASASASASASPSAGSSEDLQLTAKEKLLKDKVYAREQNLGIALWEIRRARWLTPDGCDDVDEKVAQRASEHSIKHISRDSFPRIYKEFVEKAKPLKSGKYINLEDMVVVINAGWVHDKVWDAAMKGLPS